MEERKQRKFSYYFYNPVTYVGVLISLAVLTAELFLFALEFINHGRNLYLGLISFVFLPVFLIFGLILIPVGLVWKKRREKKGKPEIEFRRIRIDLSLSHHRNALLVFIFGTAILLLMTLVGTYKAFQYTESVDFCGLTCHHVMKPEHTAYLNSPHGRVKCVDCHIGEGVDHYIESKKTGLRQLVHTLENSYKTPIETPVRSLRPAEGTCEKCHWPEKKYSTFDFKRSYFLTEGEEKRWDMRMLLSVGGGSHGAEGVHAHMNVDQEIYYAAEDARRQKITWVKSVAKDGKETLYVTPKSKFKDTPPTKQEIRKMDCIDCHNRPTHHFNAPYRLVNEGMSSGKIDPSLPEIKEQAMEILADEYATEDEAMRSIPEKLMGYYQKKHPEIAETKTTEIMSSAEYLKDVFKKNIFPEMKARWDSFPDNIGHLVSPGCFRCHDNQHAAPDGRTITQDCKSCHLIIEQGPHGSVQKDLEGLDFVHPVDDENGWKEMNCNDCHTGAGP